MSEAGLRVQQQQPQPIGNKGRKPPLTVQQRKQLEYNLQSNVVGLLHNLMGGVDNSFGREVAAEECLDLVVTALKQRPLDKYTQKRGIRYLLKAGKMQDAQVITMLQKKQVGILFLRALDQFRHSNPSIRNLAQEALMCYASNWGVVAVARHSNDWFLLDVESLEIAALERDTCRYLIDNY